MSRRRAVACPLLALALFAFQNCSPKPPSGAQGARAMNYGDLKDLHDTWREFQKPKMVDGVPDHTSAAMDEQRRGLADLQRRLAAIDPSSWEVAQQVDYHIVRAEMNGLDFDHRVLRPWSKNPAFYTIVHASGTDVPAREGPERYGVINLYEYRFPVGGEKLAELRTKLEAVPALLDQARRNLTEDAKDLYFTGIQVKRQESAVLADLAKRVTGDNPDLVPAIDQARAAVDQFRVWLEERHAKMTARSGVGIENYNWYMKNVHLVPYTWQDQLVILERELGRAWSNLRLEELRNRDLPPLAPPATREEHQQRMNEAVKSLFDFLDRKEFFTVPGYVRATLDRTVGPVAPPAEWDFFTRIEYQDSLPMRCHGTHWFDLARMANEPHASPIRRVPLLYNIWDSRAEGLATGFEETMLSAGLFDVRPRARELVYMLLANRAARAMGDLRQHSNEWALDEAVRFAVDRTPRGWLSATGRTAWFDEQLYLQQPGYGTSYVVGKVHIDKLLADRARQLGDKFVLRDFMDRFHAAGMIPVSLIRWELTGLDDEVKALGINTGTR